jgi:probable F420-dependent oxidoreductase
MSCKLSVGVNLPASAAAGADPVRWARDAETLGFDFVSTADHPCGTAPTFETWTMLSWVAAQTSRIGITTRVLGVPYRSPAMVAKMAETLSRLSGGRLTLGLGGGYSDAEFRAFGLAVPSPREKVDGLGEAIEIMRGLWREPAFSYPGRLHHTLAAELEPKPAAPIPIWVGTFGPRALALTGRLADGWIPSLGHAAEADLPVMRARIRRAAEAAGRDPDSITLALNLTPDELGSGPVAVADGLRRIADLGFTAFNLSLPDLDALTRTADDVLPRLAA